MKEQELKEIERLRKAIANAKEYDEHSVAVRVDLLESFLSTIEAQAEKVTELDDLATEQAEIIRNKSKKIADQAKELEQTRDARDKALSKMASFEEMYETERATNDMIGVEREEWAKKFEQQAKELARLKERLYEEKDNSGSWHEEAIAQNKDFKQAQSEVQQLREQLNKAVEGLENAKGTIELLINDYPNELWTDNELKRWENAAGDEMNAIYSLVSLLQGKEQKEPTD